MNQPLNFTLIPPSALQPTLAAPMQPASGGSNSGRFNRVSSLLGLQDQIQLQPTSQISAVSLANPLVLFSSRSVTPVAPARPALGLAELRHQTALEKLRQMTPTELKALGENDKRAFFEALLPAAIESEKKFGVPAEVTLAQAALESGWGRAPIGGYNIFGIKGKGSQGSINVQTREFYNGRYVTIRDNFARYANFYDAIMSHGKLFHNGYYDKAMTQYAKDKDPLHFVDNIQGIYATDPEYARKIKSIIMDYGLIDMVDGTGMI